MYKIVGFKKNEGTFNGRPYCNYSLYCIAPANSGVTGNPVETIKVKPDVLERAFPDGKDIVGKEVNFAMRQYNYNGRATVAVTDIII